MSAQQVFDFFSNDLEPILNASIFTESDYRFCIANRRNPFSKFIYLFLRVLIMEAVDCWKLSLAKEIAFALAYHKGLDNKSVDRSEEMGVGVLEMRLLLGFSVMYEQAPPITYIENCISWGDCQGNTVQKEQWRIKISLLYLRNGNWS